MTSQSPPSIKTKLSPTVSNILAGSVSGMAGIVTCHPFDVIRTQMQVTQNQSVLTTIKNIHKQKSLQGFYSGLSTPFAAQAVYKSIIFTVNSWSRRELFGQKATSTAIFTSGLISGSVNTLIVAPVEIVRTKLVMSSGANGNHNSMKDVVQSIYKTRGIGGFWLGLKPAIIRDGPGMGLYMLSFELMKKFLNGSVLVDNLNIKENSLTVRVLAGGFAGITFWTWGLPVDTIKTMIEANSASLETHGKLQLLKGVSLQHLYKTLPIAYLRGIPSAAITLATYDTMIEWLNE